MRSALPHERTCRDYLGMSVSCQFRTSTSAQQTRAANVGCASRFHDGRLDQRASVCAASMTGLVMDHPTRSTFISSAAGLGLATQMAESSSAQVSGGFELSAASKRLLSEFGLTYPIFQAPVGGGAGPELTVAVINSGAMAGMPVWPFPTNEAVARVARVRSATSKPFFVNYVLAFEPRSLPAVLEAGAPIVQKPEV